MMQSLHLDPLCEEIGFTQYDDGHWQVFITIEGCSKLLNQHPQFNGLVFNQADTLVEGVPEWIECSIYRRDRIMPITVREYLKEVRSEKEIWQKMPRRMLRHRALQQCARLAMGIAFIEPRETVSHKGSAENLYQGKNSIYDDVPIQITQVERLKKFLGNGII